MLGILKLSRSSFYSFLKPGPWLGHFLTAQQRNNSSTSSHGQDGNFELQTTEIQQTTIGMIIIVKTSPVQKFPFNRCLIKNNSPANLKPNITSRQMISSQPYQHSHSARRGFIKHIPAAGQPDSCSVLSFRRDATSSDPVKLYTNIPVGLAVRYLPYESTRASS